MCKWNMFPIIPTPKTPSTTPIRPSGPTKITFSLFVLVTPFVRIYNTNRISGIERLHLSENWVCPFKSLSIAISSSETHLNGNKVLMINLWISGVPCFSPRFSYKPMPSQVGSKYASPFGVSLFPPGRFGLGPPVRTTPARFGIGTVISYIAKPWPMAGSILQMKHGDFQEHTVTKCNKLP